MKRIVFAALLVTSVLVPTVLTGLSTPAQADVVAVSLPTAVTISDRTVSFSGTVRLGPTATGLRSASLWFRYPSALSSTRVGTATSRRPGLLVITASLDAARITPGLNQIQVEDDEDGDTRTILLDLRRLSRVTIISAQFRSTGRAALAVKVTHYDPKLGRFAPSRFSPVRLQEKIGGTWVPVAQVTTGVSGRAEALVPVSRGLRHDFRAVRPSGATVLAATSTTIHTDRAEGPRILNPHPIADPLN